MAVEIERKFLLDVHVGQKFHANDAYEINQIQQFYLNAGPGVELRVRVKSNGTKESCCLTLKSKDTSSAARFEFEFDIEKEKAAEMVAAFNGYGLKKARAFVDLDGVQWEIDRFSFGEETFFLAEVEFDSLEESEKFQPPFWAGREVTG